MSHPTRTDEIATQEIKVPAPSAFEVDFVSFLVDVHELTSLCSCVMRLNRIINFSNARCVLFLPEWMPSWS